MLHALPAAARRLLRPSSTGYSLAALLTLCLGVAAVLVVHGLLHRALFQPLPIADESRVLWLGNSHAERGVRRFATSHADFRSLREAMGSVQPLAAIRRRALSLESADGAERIDALRRPA
jgi:hypothetical protein